MIPESTNDPHTRLVRAVVQYCTTVSGVTLVRIRRRASSVSQLTRALQYNHNLVSLPWLNNGYTRPTKSAVNRNAISRLARTSYICSGIYEFTYVANTKQPGRRGPIGMSARHNSSYASTYIDSTDFSTCFLIDAPAPCNTTRTRTWQRFERGPHWKYDNSKFLRQDLCV